MEWRWWMSTKVAKLKFILFQFFQCRNSLGAKTPRVLLWVCVYYHFLVQFFAIFCQKNSTSHIVHSPFSWLIFTWAWYSQQSYSGNGITDSTKLSSFHFSSFQSWVKWSRLEFLMKKDPLNLYWWLFWNNARVLFLTNCSTSSSHV